MTKLLLDPEGGEGSAGAPEGQSGQGQPAEGFKWRDHIPEEYKTEPSLEVLPDDFGEFVKSHVNLRKKLGKKLLEPPSPDWDEKQRGEFYNAIGRPESPDKYELPEMDLPENLNLSDERVGKFKEKAHSLGMTGEQLKGVMEFYVEDLKEYLSLVENQKSQGISEAQKALQKEWGEGYETNLAVTKKALEHFAGPELLQKLDETGLGNDPILAKAFHQIGMQMLEDNAKGKGPGLSGLTREQSAQLEIKKLREDPIFMKAYDDINDPAHKASIARMQQLYKVAHPGQAS